MVLLVALAAILVVTALGLRRSRAASRARDVAPVVRESPSETTSLTNSETYEACAYAAQAGGNCRNTGNFN
jgi:hypothetical protein